VFNPARQAEDEGRPDPLQPTLKYYFTSGVGLLEVSGEKPAGETPQKIRTKFTHMQSANIGTFRKSYVI